MQNILNLLKLQIDNKSDILKTKSPKKMIISIVKVAILMALVSVAVWLVAGRIFVLGIKINAELIGILLLALQLISIIFTTGRIITTLYLNKDNEMLICFPISVNQLFISKILLIYLKELAVNAMIMAPIFITLGLIGGMGASFYLSFIGYLFILPVLPIILGAFISLLVMKILKFLKKHTALSIVLMLILIAGCLIGYIFLISGFVGTFNIASQQLETVRQINASIENVGKYIPIYYQLGAAMFDFQKWWYITVFIVGCAALFVGAIFIMKKFFFKTAMSSFESGSNGAVKKGKFKKLSPFLSLMLREIKCIFRSQSDIFEYFLFTLLMPFIVFSYDKLLMSITVNQAGINMIAGSHVMVVAILAMLSNIVSSCTISREGTNFYISKIMPVDYYTQIFAKLIFNVIFTVGSLLVTMIVSCFIYPAWQIILGTLAVMFASIGHAAMSIEMDIKSPTKKFEGDGKSATVSKSMTKSILFGLLIGFVLGLIIILMSSFEKIVVPYIIIIAIGFVFMAYRLYVLIVRINLQYDKIEM